MCFLRSTANGESGKFWFNWWQESKKRCPNITPLARDLHAIRATPAAGENHFFTSRRFDIGQSHKSRGWHYICKYVSSILVIVCWVRVFGMLTKGFGFFFVAGLIWGGCQCNGSTLVWALDLCGYFGVVVGVVRLRLLMNASDVGRWRIGQAVCSWALFLLVRFQNFGLLGQLGVRAGLELTVWDEACEKSDRMGW